MRRMMQSLFLIVCFGVPAFAQQGNSSLLYSDSSANQIGSETNDAGRIPAGKPITSEIGAPMVESGYSHNPYTQPACNGPYSQLGAKMSCSDASPNLWCGYASERAALAAKVMKHVDMQCGCSATHGGCSTLHSAPCESGCGGSERGCAVKAPKINRYKEPFSTLYSDPCIQCTTGKCGLGHRHHGGMQPVGCSTCAPTSAPVYSNQHHTNGCASVPAATNTMAPANGALANRQFVQPNPANMMR